MTHRAAILLFSLGSACGYDARDVAVAALPEGTESSTGTGGTTAASDTGVADTSPALLDLPPAGSTTQAEAACVSFSVMGEVIRKPADIILVVDNSPSMIEETQAVREHLNAFSQQIVDAGIDIRVLLLTAYPDPNAAPSIDTGVCIDPPLGGGGCPLEDDNQPLFAHVQQIIGSEHALAKVLSTHPVWQPMMRADSTKHVIVITDDDSYVTAGEFDEQFRALDPDGGYDDYRLHGIVSTSQCGGEGSIGEEYIALAELTDGVIGDLCEQQFQPLFDELSTAVLEGTGLACAWPLPEAPDGQSIDATTVEVALELDGVSLQPARVADAASCPVGGHGWYLDDPDDPSMIVTCPSTCAAVTAAQTAELDVEVGCAFVPAG